MLHLFWLFKNLLISCARVGDTRTHTHKNLHVRAANTASHTHKHTRAQLETSDWVTYEKVIGRVGVEERGRGQNIGHAQWSKKINIKLKPTKSQRERFEVKANERIQRKLPNLHTHTQYTHVRAWVSGCV